MKKRNLMKIIFFVLILGTLLCIIRYPRMKEKKYYMDKNNYITEEAIVDNIIYNEEQEYIVFWLSEIDDSYQSSDFIIEGASVPIIIENGVLDKIHIGDKIKYTSAPAYFGNGYFMPIVEINFADEELLSFEVGYKNLLKLY